ncbi:MAG: FAD-binding protein, partial [Meiothermus sp.]
VVTGLTLEVIPAFEVRQEVYENLPLAELEANFEAVMGGAYSVSLFTDWRQARFTQVWRKSRVEEGLPLKAEPSWFGATAAPAQRHMLSGHSAENTTAQMGIPGPWFERLPHFRMGHTPSSGEELQSEYLVPRPYALKAIREVYGLGERIASILQISEIRTIAADDLWMSPYYQQPCVGFHFTWVKDWSAVRQLLPVLEERLEPFEARPHWGKLFTMSPERIGALFRRLPEFRELLQTYDPKGKFRNAFLDEYLF